MYAPFLQKALEEIQQAKLERPNLTAYVGDLRCGKCFKLMHVAIHENLPPLAFCASSTCDEYEKWYNLPRVELVRRED